MRKDTVLGRWLVLMNECFHYSFQHQFQKGLKLSPCSLQDLSRILQELMWRMMRRRYLYNNYYMYILIDAVTI